MKDIEEGPEQFKKIWEGRFNELDKVLLNLKTQKK